MRVHDYDAEKKGKYKLYADKHRKGEYTNVDVGDRVLIKQDKTEKFTKPFNATPNTVIRKARNKITVESPSGAQYSRNTTSVRKCVEKETQYKQDSRKVEDDSCTEDTNQQTVLEGSDRPVYNRVSQRRHICEAQKGTECPKNLQTLSLGEFLNW